MGDQRAISSREATGERRSAAREQFCALGFGETGLRELGLKVREDGAIALAAERSALEQVEAGFEHQGIDEARRLYLRCLLRSQPVDRLLHQRLDALEPLDISLDRKSTRLHSSH